MQIIPSCFGHVKGAFTGANEMKQGMLEKADGGILFLDEVHRLNEESQEKLFTFMDRGVFRRMGESEGEHTSNVRLVFATTEDPKTHFLQTFIRRIPLNVYIPSLNERGKFEKQLFLYNFLLKEAKVLKRDIQLSSMAVTVLLENTYKGNIGEF
ncbi:sigma 54-interacting transcriptional regulator [Bacillus massilioanorexius]|nr:sigma 54-interacting transcriptional regulator [Bacillus massilioanorexius]